MRPSIRFYIKRTKTKGRYYLKAIGANNECLFVSGLGSKEKIMAILEYFELFVTEYDGSLNYTELHIATNRHKIVPFIDYSNDNKPYIVFQATKKYYASNGFTIMRVIIWPIVKLMNPNRQQRNWGRSLMTTRKSTNKVQFAMVSLDEYRYRCQCGGPAFVDTEAGYLCKECLAKRNDKFWKMRYGNHKG